MGGSPVKKLFFLFVILLCGLHLIPNTLLAGKRITDRIRIDFSVVSKSGKGLTGGWHYKGKPFTRDIDFSIVDLDGVKVLKVASRKSSGTILYDLSTIDLKKYPLMRWKWMAVRLPDGACATDPKRDDQVQILWHSAGKQKPKKGKAVSPATDLAWYW